MSWGVRRDDLLEAIRILDFVPSQSGVPASDFFRVEKHPTMESAIQMMVGSGPVAEIQLMGKGEWPVKKPFFLARAEFSHFATFSTESTNKAMFEFTMDEELKLRHGDRFSKFLPQPSIVGYSQLGALKNHNQLVFSEEAIDLMGCAAECAASELQLPHLGCIMIRPEKTGVELYSTNQKVVFRGKTKLESPLPDSIPFPLGMLNVIRGDGLRSLRWTGDCVVARFPNGKVWQTTVAKAKKEFPKDSIDKMLKAGSQEELRVFRVAGEDFNRIAERLTYYLQSVKKSDWVMTIVGRKGNNRLSIVCRLPHVVFKEQIGCLDMITKDFKLEWPLSMIAPVLSFIGRRSKKALVAGLNKDGQNSYMRCGGIEMMIPAVAV